MPVAVDATWRPRTRDSAWFFCPSSVIGAPPIVTVPRAVPNAPAGPDPPEQPLGEFPPVGK